METVLPLRGGIGIFVSVTTVVSPAIGGSRVGCGVGAPDPAALPPAVGAGVALGAAVVALGAAVVAIAAVVDDGDGPAAEPHDVIRITPAARIANQPAPNRTPIVVSPASNGGKYANPAARAYRAEGYLRYALGRPTPQRDASADRRRAERSPRRGSMSARCF